MIVAVLLIFSVGFSQPYLLFNTADTSLGLAVASLNLSTRSIDYQTTDRFLVDYRDGKCLLQTIDETAACLARDGLGVIFSHTDGNGIMNPVIVSDSLMAYVDWDNKFFLYNWHSQSKSLIDTSVGSWMRAYVSNNGKFLAYIQDTTPYDESGPPRLLRIYDIADSTKTTVYDSAYSLVDNGTVIDWQKNDSTLLFTKFDSSTSRSGDMASLCTVNLYSREVRRIYAPTGRGEEIFFSIYSFLESRVLFTTFNDNDSSNKIISVDTSGNADTILNLVWPNCAQTRTCYTDDDYTVITFISEEFDMNGKIGLLNHNTGTIDTLISDIPLFIAFPYFLVDHNPLISVEKKHSRMIRASGFFSVSPNPAGSAIRVSFRDRPPAECRLEVLDIHGRVVTSLDRLNSAEIPVSLRNQPNGIYFIKLSSSGSSEVRKFLKVR